MNERPVILLGAGGHANVLLEILQLRSIKVIGVTTPDVDMSTVDVPVIGADDAIYNYEPEQIALVNGIGSVSSTQKREEVFQIFKKAGYSFLNVIHPSAIISPNANIGEGVQIMASSIVQPKTIVGLNTIINTGAIVEHHCHIGNHVHIAPGATLSGNVEIGDGAHIGTGANIIQNVVIGERTLIGAGALVNRDVSPRVKAYGIPAREVRA